MLKNFAAYSQTFKDDTRLLNQLYETAHLIPSLNGLYLSIENSVDKPALQLGSNKVSSWYDLSGTTNYLYAESVDSAPEYRQSDSLLNNASSIVFASSGNQRLLFKYPYRVKTVIIVYYLRSHGAYLFYTPGQTPPPDSLYFDYLPSLTNKLWTSCTLSNNLAVNATSRINKQVVASNVNLPLNSSRILTVTNLGGNQGGVELHGIGGRHGLPNGGEFTRVITDSVKGGIAAILTFSEVLSIEQIESLEDLLQESYISYNGPSLSEVISLKYLVNQSISYDFASKVIDEWSPIVSYELLSPSSLTMSFTGSVLTGTVSSVYTGEVVIRITNQAGLSSVFSISLEIVRPDPLTALLPQQNNLKLALSSGYDSTDGSSYGVYTNEQGEVLKWEDSRRIGTIFSLSSESALKALQVMEAGQPTVRFNSNLLNSLSNEQYTLSTNIQGKTFLWVYKQRYYGRRPLARGLYDIRGTGVLITPSSTTQVHGQTVETRLRTRVNKVTKNSLLYKLPLDYLGFITATQQDNELISIQGLDSLRGDLYYLAVWDTVLTDTELATALEILAGRYINIDLPYIVSTDREFVNEADVEIDLTTKVVDFKDRQLTYTFLQNHYNATVTNNILRFIGVTDELLTFSILVANSDGFTTTLTFEVDITLRTNSLYLSIKQYLNSLINPPTIPNLYLATNDSLIRDTNQTLVTWKDYRLVGNELSNQGTSPIPRAELGGKLALNFDSNGSDYLDFALTESVTASTWVLVFIRPLGISGSITLLGNDTQPLASGSSSALFNPGVSSPNVLSGTKYLNHAVVTNDVEVLPSIVNALYLNTTAAITVDSIAKDRAFINSSFKGDLALLFTLNRALSYFEWYILETIIRDYYDAVRFVLLLHFNNNSIDSSGENLLLSGSSVYSSVAKFNSHSLLLSSSLVSAASNYTTAYLRESFSISFWLLINQALSAEAIQYIYRQAGLEIYVRAGTLFVGAVSTTSEAFLTYNIPASFYSPIPSTAGFHNIEVSQKSTEAGSTLYLFIDGVLQDSYANELYFTQVDSLLQIGGNQQLPPNTTILLDELVIVRRGYLHESSFIPANAEYN